MALVILLRIFGVCGGLNPPLHHIHIIFIIFDKLIGLCQCNQAPSFALSYKLYLQIL
jgi:hypothetical protein